jgi:hypothetical protein
MPMSFKVTQPPDSRKNFEFSPVIGYIQKQAKINIWVKFTAGRELEGQLAAYAKGAGQFEVPFEVEIKEQVLPVTFAIKFKITSDQVLITPS